MSSKGNVKWLLIMEYIDDYKCIENSREKLWTFLFIQNITGKVQLHITYTIKYILIDIKIMLEITL